MARRLDTGNFASGSTLVTDDRRSCQRSSQPPGTTSGGPGGGPIGGGPIGGRYPPPCPYCRPTYPGPYIPPYAAPYGSLNIAGGGCTGRCGTIAPCAGLMYPGCIACGPRFAYRPLCIPDGIRRPS